MCKPPRLYLTVNIVVFFPLAEKPQTAVLVSYTAVVPLTVQCSPAAPLGVGEAKVQLRFWGADSNC